MISIRLVSLDIFGLCCFRNIIRVEFQSKQEILYGTNNSGKSSFLKCLAFLLDDKNEYSTLTNQDVLTAGAELVLCIAINDKYVYKKKTFPKKGSCKCKVEYENTNDSDLLLLERINVRYFTSERLYTKKDIEYKNYESHVRDRVFYELVDLINDFEARANSLLTVENTGQPQSFSINYKWDKLLELVENKGIESYSTTERKQMIWRMMIRDINQYIIVLADDIDAFWSPEMVKSALDSITDKVLMTIATVRTPYKFCTGIIDKSFQSVMKFEEYVKEMNSSNVLLIG